jgi:lysophospholipase L1-like esterase
VPTILCIGDSLTAGSDSTPGGYRTFRGTLYTLLVSAGIDGLDFIGPENRPPASGGSDGDCAAWGGARMDNTGSNGNNITDRLSSLKTSFPSPDLIVLYIGWNDVYQATASIATKFETLLDAIQTGAWSSRKVVICTLHPEPGKTEAQTGGSYAEYGAINAKIRALANGTTRVLADLAAYTGASQSAFIEELLADVQQAPDGTTVLGGGLIQNPAGGSLLTSWKSIADFNGQWARNPPYPYGAGGGSTSMDPTAESVVGGVNRFTTSAAAVVPWFWGYPAPGHASTNTCIEIRNGYAGAKRVGGGWDWFFEGARMGAPNDYSPSLPRDQSTGFGTYAVGWRDDGITSWIKPDGNWGIEVWPVDTNPSRGILTFVGGWNRDLMANAECYVWGVQARLALINPNGVDDRAQARFLVKTGMDIASSLGGARYDRWGWPYGMMDGSSGRWKLLRSNDWTHVGAVSIGKGGAGSTATNSHWEDPGLQPPLANWSPATTYNDISTYSLSATDLRSSPPPVPSYWEATGGTGSGYAEVDYWFNPGINARDIHLNQSGADKIAGVIARAIVSSGALGSGSSGGTIFSLLPGLPTKPNVFAKLNGSSKKNVEPKNRDANSAPVWGDATSIPTATVGASYSAQLLATGSPAPTFSIISGAPSWLACSSAGVLSNSSAITGGEASYSIVFRATSSAGTTDRTLTLQVVAGASVTTAALPNAVVGVAYSQALAASGVAPFLWSISSGTLPAGLVLSGNTISGTPTTAATSSFTVQVTDAIGRTATRSLSIVVGAAGSAPTITTTTLPGGTVGVAYSATVAATGTGTITRTIVSGALPTGLSIAGSTGVISGTPTLAGGHAFTVRAENAYGYAEASYYVTIAATATAPVESPWARFIRQ